VSPRIHARLGARSLSPAAQWQSATLRARVTRGDGEPVAIDLRHLPAQPIDVVAPATGRVELVLRTPDSTPFAVQPAPFQRALIVPRGGMAKPIAPGIDTASWQADGRAVFPHVALGEQLELLERTNWYEGLKFAGPTRAGEHVVVDVPIVAGSVWVLGHLADPEGRPWTHDATLHLGAGQDHLPGNAAGSFCVPVPAHLGRQPKAFVVADEGRLGTEIVFPAPLAVGRNDLGAIGLRPPPLLVSGQVVVRGAAEPAALLRTLRVSIASWPPGTLFGRPDHMPVQLDADGRFDVRGMARNKDYELQIDGNVRGDLLREFTPGTAGLVLEVSQGARIDTSFLVDPSWGTLCVSFRQTGTPVTETISSTIASCNTGRVEVSTDGLAAGEYTIVAATGAQVLAEIAVTVAAGATADDPRLRDVDLRNRTAQVPVRVTDPVGAPIQAEVMVAWRPAGTGGEQWCVQPYQHHDGRGIAIVHPGAVDLCVWAPGFRAVTQDALREPIAFVLRPLPRVSLRWAEAAALPAGCTVALVWERLGDAFGPAPVESPELRAAAVVRDARRGGPLPQWLADGTAPLWAEPGVRLRVRLQLRRHGRASEPIPLSPAELDTATFVDGATVELHADAAALRQALQTLAAR
jgi:hypothetical protein